MNKFLKIYLIFFLIFTSLLFAKVPNWVKNNEHPDYPKEEYFSGIGISETRGQAEDLARANLIKEISVKIESELENIEQERIKNGKVKSLSQMKQKLTSMVSAELVGVQIVELKKDKKTYYALAALSKLQYFTALETEIDGLSERIQGLISDSEKLQEEGFLLNAISNYNDCYDLLDNYVEKSTLYTALTMRPFSALDDIDSTRIDLNIQKILTNTTLTVVQGENQRSVSGTKLPLEIIVKAVYKTPTDKVVPVQNLPIMVRYENNEKIDKLQTGSDGRIRISITAIPTDETGKEGRVIFNGVFAGVKSKIPQPQVSVHYDVEGNKITFQVNVNSDALEKKIAAMISENGYTVGKTGDFLITASDVVSEEEEVESPFGKMYMVKVDATINLIDKNSNTTIASMQASGRSTEKTTEKAKTNAYAKIKIVKKDFIAFLAKAID
ncbi:MAG: LPP20 family lipoprotein [Candidatus Marinimicrobia bacterium]|nr:LPP20 family lipoprotein [Candidatus Neomarinimicrobiota bacterium]